MYVVDAPGAFGIPDVNALQEQNKPTAPNEEPQAVEGFPGTLCTGTKVHTKLQGSYPGTSAIWSSRHIRKRLWYFLYRWRQSHLSCAGLSSCGGGQ